MKTNPVIPFAVAALALTLIPLSAADGGHDQAGSAGHEAPADHMLDGYASVIGT